MFYELRRLIASRGCVVLTSDARVRVKATGLTTYPDVTVVCGEIESDPTDRNTVLNPSVLVEVLSPSTEGYDTGEKFRNYRKIPYAQSRRVRVLRQPPGRGLRARRGKDLGA